MATIDPLTATSTCCPRHSRTCEPDRKLIDDWRSVANYCCTQCPEKDHPRHLDGAVCINPDPGWLHGAAAGLRLSARVGG